MFAHTKKSRVWLHVPFGVVLAVVVAGFLRVGVQHWRQGSVLIGGALLLAAVFRAVLPSERSGLLAIRGRAVDIVLYGVLGVLIVAIAMTITGGPLGR